MVKFVSGRPGKGKWSPAMDSIPYGFHVGWLTIGKSFRGKCETVARSQWIWICRKWVAFDGGRSKVAANNAISTVCSTISRHSDGNSVICAGESTGMWLNMENSWHESNELSSVCVCVCGKRTIERAVERGR